MPAFFGFILGVILTVGCAYVYDSSTGRTANGLSATSAGGQAPMVNWTIVSDDWQSFQTNVRSKADNLEKSFKQHS
jgi:rubredoxin